jgi:hypothetical protein
MSYSPKIKQNLAQHKGPTMKMPLGIQLGKLAVAKDVSVIDVSAQTGASRTTVYNWFAGGSVTNAYEHVVREVISTLKAR